MFFDKNKHIFNKTEFKLKFIRMQSARKTATLATDLWVETAKFEFCFPEGMCTLDIYPHPSSACI